MTNPNQRLARLCVGTWCSSRLVSTGELGRADLGPGCPSQSLWINPPWGRLAVGLNARYKEWWISSLSSFWAGFAVTCTCAIAFRCYFQAPPSLVLQPFHGDSLSFSANPFSASISQDWCQLLAASNPDGTEESLLSGLPTSTGAEAGTRECV